MECCSSVISEASAMVRCLVSEGLLTRYQIAGSAEENTEPSFADNQGL